MNGQRWLNFRPEILCLESRCLLSTVTNLNDSGPGSLRQAINDTPITGTVDFQAGLSGTITLTSAPLTISKILTITGPGASVITVSGNKTQQVFNIPAPFTVAISGLTIANGYAIVGAGISNGGALTLTGCILNGNFATTNGTTGGSGGGGIYNSGTLTVSNSTLDGNTARYDGGGSIYDSGGGIYNSGTLIVTGSSFSGNTAYLGGGIGIVSKWPFGPPGS